MSEASYVMHDKALRHLWVPHALPTVMLLWALIAYNPYGYYTLLRFVCCASFCFVALRYYGNGKAGWAWMFAMAAIIYNPFIRIHLSREIWPAMNLATILLLSLSFFAYNRNI